MKIIFDLRKTGLGNNGGSSTLIKSANTLVKLGHEVTMVDSGANQYTWEPLIAKHEIIANQTKMPNADFIIATGFKSVSETLNAPHRSGIKCHWMRGWENWQYNEEEIKNKILKVPTIKLVNGLCLQNKLEQYDIQSYLIRPGYDFDMIYPLNLRKKRDDIIVLGGLNKQGRHSNSKRTAWIIETAKVLKRKHGKKIQLWMFGMDDLPATTVVDHNVKNPTIQQKNEIYNNVDIWLSPSMLEGLHMPPAEAMITECPIVGTNAEMSGTIDYLVHEETGIVTDDNIVSFIGGAERLVLDKKLRERLGKKSRIKILGIGNRENNMQMLVDLLEQIKQHAGKR